MLALFLAALVTAGGPGPDDDPRPHLTAAPAAGIAVDGRLDDAPWADAEAASGFVQFEPTEGEPASERTEVRVLRGPDALYVGATMHDQDPASIRQALSRRDDPGDADHFVIAIDGYNDQRTARVFGVTAAGVQFDALLEGERDDDSWDAVWSSAVRVGPDGWTAEMRIPYSQLRFSEGSASWGLQFVRRIPRRGEESFWAPISREDAGSGLVEFFGRLDGLAQVRPRRVVQAVPYTLGGGSRRESDAAPGVASYGREFDVGADFKVGLGGGVLLDATVNPDFGQVEADPAELNLTTFESIFPERRPFFLEGTQIFDASFAGGGRRGDGALLYTRRIGAEAPIIGATKLTGRTDGGLSFGALGAATGADADPTRLFGSARLRQELRGQSFVGAGVSGFSGQRLGLGRSLSGALDWGLRVGADEQYLFEGILSGSLTGATDDDPDRDPRGWALYTGFDQVKGYTTFGTGLRFFSPGFDLNDVGRFRETDLAKVTLSGFHQWNEGGAIGPFRRLRSGVFSNASWTYSDGVYRGIELNSFHRGQLRGFQNVRVFTRLAGLGGQDVRETRGLGPIRNLVNGGVDLNVSTDERKRFVLEAEAFVGGDEGGGVTFNPELALDWTVSDRLRLSGSVGLQNNWGVRSWVSNETLLRDADGAFYAATEAGAPGELGADAFVPLALGAGAADALLAGVAPDAATPRAGSTAYYLPLLAPRDVRGADGSLRATVILQPNLSLQLYGQAFASRGTYGDVSLVAGPDELRPFAAFPRRQDFSFSAVRANAVLRWEYRPGSSLFVVWQRSTADELFENVLLDQAGSSPFETSTATQIADTFRLFPDDVVLVKLSYLLMR